MIKLTPKQNHLAYAGAFASPAMALWGATPATLEGMLGAFAEFGAQIDGMEAITSPANPSDYSVTLGIGKAYRFRFPGQVGGLIMPPSG